jgi:outer membrane immunogenic protein
MRRQIAPIAIALSLSVIASAVRADGDPRRAPAELPTDHAGWGWLGEVGLGYDYQFTSRIVGGVLFNYDFSDMRGKTSDAVFTTGTTSQDQTWFVGVRAGWLMTPDVLNYWSAGYTLTHFSGSSLDNSFTGAPLAGATKREAGSSAAAWK